MSNRGFDKRNGNKWIFLKGSTRIDKNLIDTGLTEIHVEKGEELKGN